MGYYNKETQLLHSLGTAEFRKLCLSGMTDGEKVRAVNKALTEKGISTEGYTPEDYLRAIESLGGEEDMGSGPISVRFTYIDPTIGNYVTKIKRCNPGGSVTPPKMFTEDIPAIPGICPELYFEGWSTDDPILDNIQQDQHFGALYIPKTGNLWLRVKVPVVLATSETPYLLVTKGGLDEELPISVNWGDGTQSSVIVTEDNQGIKHRYSNPGNYLIEVITEGKRCTLTPNSSTTGVFWPTFHCDLRFNLAQMLSLLVLGKYATNSLDSSPLANCYKLKSVVLSPNIGSIYDNAFSSCNSLQELVLSPNLQTLPYNTISSGGSVDYLILPSSIKTISANAIASNNNIGILYIQNSEETLILESSMSIHQTCLVVVPDSRHSEYLRATNWSALGKKIVKKSDYEKYYAGI